MRNYSPMAARHLVFAARFVTVTFFSASVVLRPSFVSHFHCQLLCVCVCESAPSRADEANQS